MKLHRVNNSWIIFIGFYLNYYYFYEANFNEDGE